MTLRSNVYQNWTKSKTNTSGKKPNLPSQSKSKPKSRYETSLGDLVKELKAKSNKDDTKYYSGEDPPWDT